MFNLSDDYYLRKCHIKREQVPTQSLMKKKMGPALAAIYFQSMNPKLKVIAGLEPLLNGGGNNWYVSPDELLNGRAVMQPVTHKILASLNYDGIDTVGMDLFVRHRKMMNIEKQKALLESDNAWRNHVKVTCQQKWDEVSAEAKAKNAEHLKNNQQYFIYLYRQSLNNFETILLASATAEVMKTRENAITQMKNHFEAAVKFQATTLYDTYEEKLMKEKARLKAEFIEKLEICRTEMADTIHDLIVDKHVAIEKLRKYLECQNLACQVYVALKEREECFKETEASIYKHKKIVRTLADNIEFKNFEIHLARQKEKKRLAFLKIWQKKVCHVVKKFQMFVSYCLNMLPDHAEFFINLEKLMLLQLNETLEEPTAKSIIIVERETFHTPIPRPHPFYLFCDKGYKPQIDQDLCPKHCTSSASQLPVIIVNKRCIYAACDNFEQYSNKIKEFVHGKRGDDADFEDNVIYEHCVPVKNTSSQQLLELKLESSLLQILQQEKSNLKDVPNKCGVCELPYCFCSPYTTSIDASNKSKHPSPLATSTSRVSENKIISDVRRMELEHEREPKWESFMEYIEPKKCTCAKKAKKHLIEHLPAYMRRTSRFEPPDLPSYEMCSVTALKQLVKNAKRKSSVTTSLTKVPSKSKDVGTQYIDPEFEMLCSCFTDDEVCSFLSDIKIDPTMFHSSTTAGEFKILGSSVSHTFMTRQTSAFATDRAISLRNLIEDLPDLQEIFKKKDCVFE